VESQITPVTLETRAVFTGIMAGRWCESRAQRNGLCDRVKQWMSLG